MTSLTLTPTHAPAVLRGPRRRVWWRDAVGVVCWGTALFVIALWLRGGGLQDLQHTSADRFTSLGRIAGLLSADLLLIQVFLMARVPMIERSYGQDELARRHRLVGFWSFNLLLAHIALITVGYAASARAGLVHELVNLVLTYPGMLLATAATASLVLVVVTSIRKARRRLRYEAWHLLHLYAYVGVGLSIPHEIWTGADFTSSPAARAFWWSAYALAAAAVLIYRVGTPVARTLRHQMTVSAVTQVGDDVVSVQVAGRRLDRLKVHPGQFFVWRFMDGPGWTRGNPYSLSGTPTSTSLQIAVKDLGQGSGRLRHLKAGTRVLVEGPYGRLTGEDRVTDSLLMIACGIGITPLKALLETLDYAPGKATLLYRGRSEDELVFRTELEELARQRGIQVRYVLGPRARGRESWLPEHLEKWQDSSILSRLVPDIAQRDVFVCGPESWMDCVLDAARECGVPSAQLHEERFAW